MNDFKDAARAAAGSVFDVIRHIIAEHPDLFEKTNETQWAARDVLNIEITKHYADIEATFDELRKIADAAIHYVNSIQGGYYEKDQEEAYVDLIAAIADPRIAALIAARKDEGNE